MLQQQRQPLFLRAERPGVSILAAIRRASSEHCVLVQTRDNAGTLSGYPIPR